nr:uncharacterized protein LOC109160647 [Ipomoea batatas]
MPVVAIIKMTYEKLALMFAERRTKGLIMQQAGLQWPKRILDDILKGRVTSIGQ